MKILRVVAIWSAWMSWALAPPGLLGASAAGAATFNVQDDPLFSNANTTITSYLIARHAKGMNKVCVLGNAASDQTRSAWIIWRQRKEIILWEGQDLVATGPRRVLRVNKDVVASEARLRGSSYLMTRAWVKDLVSQCRKSGLQLVIPLEK